ncbi:CD209 antigen-like protein E [Amphibalanus amphitrite]|uniref:CD209 antigen-like protein E n=1 Tax=Amphibalanus amphitrite TaxID=1232801 RepID=A0A6A4W785_AMPAM|nr:CD209 antigen-like protein E [Amphibalanus amphitrite]
METFKLVYYSLGLVSSTWAGISDTEVEGTWNCALLAGASYVRRLDVFSAGQLAESAAPSRLSCAAWCNRTSGCVGFTFTDGGQCQLFNQVYNSAADTSAMMSVDYSRPSMSPCPTGWFPFRDRCFFRGVFDTAQIWDAHRAACQSLGKQSDLAVPDDVQENSWLLYHPSRSTSGEFIGVKLENGAFTGPDGAAVSFQLPMVSSPQDPGHVNVRVNHAIDYNAWGSSKTMSLYICEAPSHCQLTSPCPAGWLFVDDYCYHYVSTAMAWQAADDHCAGLQPGARLSPVINMETFKLVYYSLGLASSTWAGISDTEVEGTWKSVDGSTSSFAWRSTSEPNGGTAENCVEMSTSGGNDAGCSGGRAFVCRVLAGVCG